MAPTWKADAAPNASWQDRVEDGSRASTGPAAVVQRTAIRPVMDLGKVLGEFIEQLPAQRGLATMHSSHQFRSPTDRSALAIRDGSLSCIDAKADRKVGNAIAVEYILELANLSAN